MCAWPHFLQTFAISSRRVLTGDMRPRPRSPGRRRRTRRPGRSRPPRECVFADPGRSFLPESRPAKDSGWGGEVQSPPLLAPRRALDCRAVLAWRFQILDIFQNMESLWPFWHTSRLPARFCPRGFHPIPEPRPGVLSWQDGRRNEVYPANGADLVISNASFGTHFGSTPKGTNTRSEERRVGKECRSRWSPYH